MTTIGQMSQFSGTLAYHKQVLSLKLMSCMKYVSATMLNLADEVKWAISFTITGSSAMKDHLR